MKMRSAKSPGLESQNSFERLQKIVEKEGKSARNLVARSVPAVNEGDSGRGKVGARRRPFRTEQQLSSSERMCRAAADQYSNSTLRGDEGCRSFNKADVQARYWSYLFDNLFRAVDEIYRTCEMDCSVIECQEVMMTLDACRRDFAALIHRIEMERELESCPDLRPPGGVAWEVRKTSSPSKPPSQLSPHHEPGRRGLSPHHELGRRGAVRSLDMSCAGLSWADRVRGKTTSASQPPENDAGSKENCSDDGQEEDASGDSGTPGTGAEAGGDGGDEEAEESWSQMVKEYDESVSHRRVSWADRCKSPDTPLVLADTPRSPGRAITLHQRLSSPSRKRPIEESRRMLEEKQMKAQQARDRLVEEQRLKSKAEQEKVREAREARESRMRAWREGMEEKLLKAEQLRESHLQEKRRKAQDEDAKVSEIAFINTLEAQNRKIQVLRRHQGHEARLADMAEERARRREETTAREEAAQERRRTLEEERRAKLRDLDEKRRDQVAKIEQMRLERERAREEAAQEKARERERRLEARNTALQITAEQLEKKIQLKQDESSRRHDQQLEQIKEKAAGSRHTSCEEAPCVVPYSQRKWCTLCNIPIISDVYLQSHEKGRRHQEAMSRLPEDHAPLIITLEEESGEGGSGSKVASDRLRAGRRRAKKLRQRMAARWKEQEAKWYPEAGASSEHRQKLQRCLKDVGRLTERTELDRAQLQQLDRTLNEMARILTGKDKNDQLCFQQQGGVTMVTNLINRKLPTKTLLNVASVLQAACASHMHTCTFIVTANLFTVLVDVLVPLMSLHSDSDVELCMALLALLASIISTLSFSSSASSPAAITPSLSSALMDCISYIVSVGIIHSVSARLSAVTGPLSLTHQAQLSISAVNLLVAISAALHFRVDDVFSEKRDDPTSLTSVLQETELVGLLRLLYAMLLHDGPPRHSSHPPSLPPHTLSISTACLKAINNFAILNLHMVQACLGAEGISLEFRHVTSYLMWHCSHHHHPDLLQEVILAVGYFSVLQPDNQVFLQSGCSPTLLQLLCNLPFEYFSSPGLSEILFPTLTCACYLSHENKAILSQDMSCQLLVTFLSSHLHNDSSPTGVQNFLDLGYRFPRSCWAEALDFFSSS